MILHYEKMARLRLESAGHFRSLDYVKLAEGSDHIVGKVHFFGGGAAEAGDNYLCTRGELSAIGRDEPR